MLSCASLGQFYVKQNISFDLLLKRLPELNIRVNYYNIKHNLVHVTIPGVLAR